MTMKTISARIASLFLFPLLAIAAGCSVNPVNNTPSVTVAIVTAPKTLRLGDTLRLTATVTGDTNKSVSWSIVAPAAAVAGTVDANGLYTAPQMLSADSIAVIVRAASVARPDAADSVTIVVLKGETSVRPKVGSGYVYASIRLDSNGIKIPGSDDTSIFAVEEIGVTHGGKSDVTRMSIEGDPVYVSYESNGNVSFFMRSDIDTVNGGIWLPLPVGTKSTISLPQTIVVFSDGRRETTSVVSSYSGAEYIQVGTETFRSLKATITITSNTLYENGSSSSSTTVNEFWFAPSLGWLTRWDTQETSYSTSGVRSVRRSENRLTSYTLL